MGKRVLTPIRVDIPGPSGSLEGAIDSDSAAAPAVAVICHPHPQQLGTMENKVVTTLARAFVHLGATVVRFNFRGVGGSSGRYAGGSGEGDDALAVVQWSRERWPGRRLYLGGFSFGAGVALAIASRVAPSGLVTVAPPIARLPDDFAAPACPWLLLHGSADDVVPAEPVLAWCAKLARPPRIIVLEGAGHFFHGRLGELTDSVNEFFGADFGIRVAADGSRA